MGRPIRIQDPDLFFHITVRTDQAMYLLRPDDELNEIVHARLNRAVQIFRPELLAAVMMSNHPHLIARFPRMNKHRFMSYLLGNISTDVNILRGRYETSVFPKRYSDEPILDHDSLMRMLVYVLMNPVAANLVARPEHWPGLTTFRQSAGLREASPLPLTPPPCWKDLSELELQREFRALIEPEIARYDASRHWPVAGPRRVTKTPWWKRPKRPKMGRRAHLHGATKVIRQHGANWLDRVQTRYRNAALARRAGRECTFPFGTLPPGEVECSTQEPHRRPPRHLLGALYGPEPSD